MSELFTVTDQAGRTRYEGDSLRDAHCIWHVLAIEHELYMTDDEGDRIMDADCGGGNTLIRDMGEDDALILFDTACGLTACWDCDDFDRPPMHADDDTCDICGDMYEEHGHNMFEKHGHVDTHPFVGGLVGLGPWLGGT